MRGLERNANLVEAGATFDREASTAPCYRLWSIDDVHPAMLRVASGGRSIAVEIWLRPARRHRGDPAHRTGRAVRRQADPRRRQRGARRPRRAGARGRPARDHRARRLASLRRSAGLAGRKDRLSGPSSAATLRAVERVVIFRLGSLGDTVVALPCFHLIERAFPDAERIVLTNHPVSSKAPAVESVLRSSGLIHGTVSYQIGSRNPREAARARSRAARPSRTGPHLSAGSQCRRSAARRCVLSAVRVSAHHRGAPSGLDGACWPARRGAA